MDKVAAGARRARRDLFNETGAKTGLAGALVEKDFWVCWTLRRLFALPRTREHLIFKGGTSLSKVYGIIRRFSEDIDLTIGRELLGFSGERDPARITSRKKREQQTEAMMAACSALVLGDLRRELGEAFAGILGPAGPEKNWEITPDESDPDKQTLLFHYPATADRVEYIKPAVSMEFGCRAEPWPTETARIKPYAAEAFPKPFSDPECEVVVLTAERTFWEKATILHQEAHRPAEKPLPEQYSRHYHDLAQFARSERKARALADKELLRRVVEHKQAFFRVGWSQLNLAMPGTFRLQPPPERVPELKADYQEMGVMMMGEAPTFDEILETLRQLEAEINAL